MTITAKFNGKTFVPDEPVKLSQGERVVLKVFRDVTIIGPATGGSTVQDWADSGIIGAWAHRKDIKNSAAFARKLRKRAESRGPRG